jgi:hypothetical protein
MLPRTAEPWHGRAQQTTDLAPQLAIVTVKSAFAAFEPARRPAVIPLRFRRTTMLSRFTLACLTAGLALPALAQTQGSYITTLPEGASRVSKIIGTDVTGLDIRQIGEVKDVVLDRDGRAVAVVIASGGVLGIGEKSVAVPFDALLWNYDVSPTSGASSSNTGGVRTGDGALEAQRAETTSPGPENVEATGTVGDPQQPAEGLRPQGATTPVTGQGEPSSAVLRMTQQQLRDAPEFRSR